jgi:20S proteasome subunit alpha 6
MLGHEKYDQDCITFSPQGRLNQVEYASEAVKQGMPVLGLRSDTHVVICTFQKAMSELASYQQKIFKIDDHMCMGMAGLTADGRVLSEHMRGECLEHKYKFESNMPVGRLVTQVADMSQQKTQVASKRPYGIGLLVGGVDATGPHLFETCPNGEFFEYHAMAIGGRSTSAKTYLERHFEKFGTMSKEELIQHAVEAMNRTTTASDTTLNTKNTSLAFIGPDAKFTRLTDEELQKYIDKCEKKEPESMEVDAGAEPAAPA